jgi:hypothetical protein
VETTTSLRLRYVTGFTYDSQGHLQLAPGSEGRCAFSDEGFIATFDAGGRVRIPADTITFVEVRGTTRNIATQRRGSRGYSPRH